MIRFTSARQLADRATLLMGRCVLALMVLFGLLAGHDALAQASWSGVSVTPGSGTVDASTGKLNVTVTGSVLATTAGGAVNSVSLYYDNNEVQAQDFAIVLGPDGETPINTRRDFTFSLQVDAGVRSIQLGAATTDGAMGYTAVYTVNAAAIVLTNGATFVSQSVPSTMVAGQTYNVSVTMRNSGTRTWAPGGAQPHGLGSQNPQDNYIWMVKNRVPLTAPVAPGAIVTFNFTVTAPNNGGTLAFQWGMVQDGAEWFGELSGNVNVVVAVPQPGATFTSPADGSVYTASGGTATVAFAGTAFPGSGAVLSSVELREGGVAFATGAAAISGNKALALGTHSIELRALDSRGQVASVYRTVTVRPVAPVVAITSPGNGATIPASTGTAAVPIAASATAAAGASISQMRLFVDNVLVPGATTAGAALSTTQTLSAGGHLIGVEATDNYGNVSTRSTVNITLQAPGPTVTLASPADNAAYLAIGATAAVTVQGSATAVGGVAITKLELIDNGAVIDTVGGVAAYSKSVTLAPGVHTLSLRATNASNVTGSATPVVVTVISQVDGDSATQAAVVSVPAAMRSGQPYTVTVSMFNNGTTTWTDATAYRLGAQNPLDNRIWGGRAYLGAAVAPGQVATFTFLVSAPAQPGTYIFQWQMVREKVRWFGALTRPLSIAVTAGAGPAVTLAANPANVRVTGTQTQSVNFTGLGSRAGGTLAKLELFQNAGRGYAMTPVASVTGAAATLNFSKALTLPAGVYAFRLRATDGAGVPTDSNQVFVNVTNSALLGATTGVRSSAAGAPALFGWVCQPGVATALTYQVLLDAPTPDSGGVLLTQGVANVGSEADNASVAAQCGSGGHHFVVDLASYTATYAGRALYVYAADAGATANVVLPCADNSCTMPGSLRVGLASPTPNAIFSLPQPAFLKLKLSNYSGNIDEVGFMVNGEWVPAIADGAAGEYSAQKSGLAARSAPYTVYARVRQSNTTVRSVEVPFYLAAASAATLTTPAANAALVTGAPQSLVAAVTGNAIAAVRFYANGTQIAVGSNSGNDWSGAWTPVSAGAVSIEARAFNTSGTQVAASAAVAVTVTQSTDGGGGPVAITPGHLGNANAGTLPGELSVSPTGNAVYKLALVVPPGSAALAPELSLNYNGDSPNGLFGLGWSMAGMSSIHRCGKTIAQDGVHGRIGFDGADRLCLDGTRLVLVNLAPSDANYWSNGAEYRTEIDTFSRVTLVAANGRTSFKVESKDGRVMTYGNTVDSNVAAIVKPVSSGAGSVQPQAKSGALSWALDSVQDRAGNYMRYSYYQDPTTGEPRPTVIRYGGVGLPAHAAVAFSYESRPDAWKRYVDEARNDLRSRTTHIKTYVGANLDGDVTVGGTVVRDYGLAYEQSPTSGRSLLKQALVSARNPQTGAMESLPATTFAWGKPDPGKTPGFVSRGSWPNAPVMTTHGKSSATNHDDYFVFADFENHGYIDVLEKRIASAMQPYSLDAESWVQANPIRMGTLATAYAYYHNNGAGFTKYQYGLDTGESFAVLDVGDFDGDGSPDLVASTGAGPKICISPLGKGLPAGASARIVFTCASASTRPAVGTNVVYDLPHVVDVDGDGRAALYSLINPVTASADLYVQNQKLVDKTPPYGVLEYEYQMYGMQSQPEQAYVSYAQSVDLAGNSKAHDVRWSQAYFLLDQTDADGTVVRTNSWKNLLPTVAATNFRRPGTSPMTVASYMYPEYASPGTFPNIGWAPYKFDAPQPSASVGADFNGRGYSGVAFGFLEQKMNPNTQIAYASRAELTVCLSTGRALDCGVRQKYSGGNYVAVRAVSDFVGDGHPQILVETMQNSATRLPIPTSALQLCRVTGDDLVGTAADSNINCTPWSGLTIPLATNPSEAGDRLLFLDLLGTGRTQVVYYHAGKMDANNVWRGDDRWEILEPLDVAVAGQSLDRLYQVTNGLGAKSTVIYADGLASGAVTRSSGTTLAYPQRTATPTAKVVTGLASSNGVSGDRRSSYRYQDAAIDLAGRGALGFAKVSATDEQTSVVTTTSYGQAWPLTGMSLSVTTTLNGCLLSDLQNRIGVKQIAQSNGAATLFPFIAGSVQKRKDLDCSDLGTTTLAGDGVPDVEYDSWGNLLKSVATVTGSLARPGSYVSTTNSNVYFAADMAHWQVGLARSTVVKKTRSSDSASVVRTADFTYEPNFSGQVRTVTVEPSNSALKSVTTFDRNAFGLVRQKTLSWTDTTLGAQSRGETTGYDANGRFATTWSNALAQQQTRTFSAGTGAMTSMKDANLLTTTWTVDGFGRVLVETRPDGNETRKYIKQCDSACPAGAAVATVTEFFHGVDRIAVPQVVHADHAGHVLHTLTWGFDGRQIEAEQTYDARGLLFETFQPHYATEVAVLAQRTTYDKRDRALTVVTLDETGASQTATTEYKGFAVAYKNAKGQARLVWRDALGRTERVNDALGNNTLLAYDPFDNLTQTIDPNGNVVTMVYDTLGHKIELNDPDLGRVTYGVDAIGQIRSEVNPEQRKKSQVTTYAYDGLGRLTDRLEPSLQSHWVFDTAAKGVGQLAEAFTGTAAVKDYRRVHTYDWAGRAQSTTQTIRGVAYSSAPTYDAWGRVTNQRARRGAEVAKDFGMRYNKQGYLVRVERAARSLWQVDAKDAAQRVTAATLGNGLLESQTYNIYTSRLTGGMLKNAAQARRLQEGYQYDILGKVLNRTQAWDTGNFSESFTYDELNRVKTSQVLGQALQTYAYDKLGNLTSKTGVGTYDYGVQGAGVRQPHAVKGIGADVYQYDDNGNRLSGGGRGVTWTSFNMPDVITKGTQSSAFVYGTEHQRLVQTRKDGSTVIYAGTQEVETVAGVTVVRTYWPFGLGMEVDKAGAATELNWVHKDRLDSVAAITDQNGNLKERLEYDLWGKRRTLDGAATPDTLDGQVDNKGYTGHEMLDLLDLIHMNGRVYDPLTTRFLSPDPFVNDAANGQSYNRYAYVLNDPGNLIDPTGYEDCESATLCRITRSLPNNVAQLEVIAVSAHRAFTTGVQKVASQAPRVMKSFGQGFVFGAVRALPLAGATVIAGGGPFNLVTDGIAIGEVGGSGLANGLRVTLAEVVVILNEDQGKSGEQALSGGKDDTNSAPPVPGDLVGDQSDPRAGTSNSGKRHTSGPLTPENGGTGDAEKDFDKLTGGTGKPFPGSDGRSKIPGAQVGDNGVWIRPGTKNPGDGPRIEIPGNGNKLPETLHY